MARRSEGICILLALALASALAGCASSDCPPSPRPAAHVWNWQEGPLGLESLGEALEEDGWTVAAPGTRPDFNATGISATRAIGDADFELRVVTFDGASSATLTSSETVRMTEESVRALDPVIEGANRTLARHLGPPHDVRYLAGFPCP